jgi:hypothetical protein
MKPRAPDSIWKRADREGWSPALLDELWRPAPAFIGPAGPPMVIWARDREAQREWRLACNLGPQASPLAAGVDKAGEIVPVSDSKPLAAFPIDFEADAA